MEIIEIIPQEEISLCNFPPRPMTYTYLVRWHLVIYRDEKGKIYRKMESGEPVYLDDLPPLQRTLVQIMGQCTNVLNSLVPKKQFTHEFSNK